jgi:hypothetical protein
MAKKKQYPKKLRATLERVRANKDVPKADEKNPFGYSTMGQELAHRWKVHFLGTRVDEEKGKLDMTYVFVEPERRLEPLFHQLAPWCQKVEPADLT